MSTAETFINESGFIRPMEYEFRQNRISFAKELNYLDRFVIDFCEHLSDLKIRFVLVSGYISILFGRSRETEDVDLLVDELSFEEFKGLWDLLSEDFECLNTADCKGAFEEYLRAGHAIRFSRKGRFIPNMELKFKKTSTDGFVMENSIELVLNGLHRLRISPIELQIAYKLYLGSDKDLEDAKFLYELFFDDISHEKLEGFLSWFDEGTRIRFKRIARE